MPSKDVGRYKRMAVEDDGCARAERPGQEAMPSRSQPAMRARWRVGHAPLAKRAVARNLL